MFVYLVLLTVWKGINVHPNFRKKFDSKWFIVHYNPKTTYSEENHAEPMFFLQIKAKRNHLCLFQIILIEFVAWWPCLKMHILRFTQWMKVGIAKRREHCCVEFYGAKDEVSFEIIHQESDSGKNKINLFLCS